MLFSRTPGLITVAALLWTGFLDAKIIVTGATTGFDTTSNIRPFRQEISGFSRSGPSWDLYVQALRRFQDDDLMNPLSYFQIAGIHGYPARPWDVVSGQADYQGGFCMHNSVLFPIWHRPYLALYEQIVSNHALAIAREYLSEQRAVYVAAAETLRIPYWDWARNSTLPDVATMYQITINTPKGRQDIRNPLLRYDFPVDMLASNYFPNNAAVIDLSRLSFTARHYSSTTKESNQTAVAAALSNTSPGYLSKVYELLTTIDNYTTFAAYELNGVINPDMNLESIHGSIHNAIGGIAPASGHMTVTWMSAYDPIFWLHHTNVDRLTAMWQALHPSSYVEPAFNHYGSYYIAKGSTDTVNTPLAPFHAHDSAMWTAATAKDIATFGYAYPEVATSNFSRSGHVADVTRRVNQLYNQGVSPSRDSPRQLYHQRSTSITQALSNINANTALQLHVNNLDIRWYFRVSINKFAAVKGTVVYFFIGESGARGESFTTAANVIGVYEPPFVLDAAARTASGGDVSCSHLIAAAVDKGILKDMTPQTVVPFLQRHVTIRGLDSYGKEIRIQAMSGVEITIVSRDVQPRKSMAEFPVYSDFVKHGTLQPSIIEYS